VCVVAGVWGRRGEDSALWGMPLRFLFMPFLGKVERRKKRDCSEKARFACLGTIPLKGGVRVQ